MPNSRQQLLLALLFCCSVTMLGIGTADGFQVSRVDPCSACATVGYWYRGGCSKLVSTLLGRSYKTTHGYTRGPAVNNDLEPGDIVGWKGRPYGHVTVYVGNGCCNCRFVDAPLDNSGGGTSRCKNGGYGRQLYYMIY